MTLASRMVALGLVLLAGCRSTEPRFGSLLADARKLQVRNDIHMVALVNGMTIAMAPDRRTNLVSVDVRYLVGSADDPPGRSGMAHLVEHLAFQFPMGSQGATLFSKLTGLTLGFNAYTSKDVTHFTATALADRIDALIELEAQRLEARCDAIDDAAFARERDVVLEEEAERSSALRDVIIAVDSALWGPGHPYARPVGSREVAAATKAEACAFYDAHYTADRAVMVVSGNFEPEVLQQRLGLRFGPITKKAAGPPVALTAPRLDGTVTRLTADIDRPIALVYLPAPSWGAPDEPVHDMLLIGLNFELTALDRETDWVVSAGASYAGDGRMRVVMIAIETATAGDLERAVDAALARGRRLYRDDDDDGHHDDDDDDDDREVNRFRAAARGQLQTRTIERFDRLDGRGAWLADFLTYAGHYEFMLANLHGLDAVTGEALVETASQLFDRKRAHLALVEPSGSATTSARELVAASAQDYDLAPWRTAIDPAEAQRTLNVPRGTTPLAVDDYTLANGLRVLLYPDLVSPIVDARLVYPSGTVDDPPGRPGTATLATGLLRHDYNRRYAPRTIALLQWVTGLGTQLERGTGPHVTMFSSRGLAVFADWHVWRLSWLLDQGVYPKDDVVAARRDLREAEVADDRSPAALGFRKYLYGERHPLARPVPTADELAAIPIDELTAWRQARFATQGATLIVTGGFKRAAMRKVIGELFGPWAAGTPAPTTRLPPPAPQPGPRWLRRDDDRLTQVTLHVGLAARSDPGRDRAARMVLTEMIEDRLRLVREGMGASYGVTVGYDHLRGGLALDIETALDPRRAPAAVKAVLDELAALHGGRADLAADFARARRRVFARTLASRTDATSVAQDLMWMVANQLSVGELNGLAGAVGRLTPAQVAAVAAADLDPARMVVMVEGRIGPVDAVLTALGASDVVRFDE